MNQINCDRCNDLMDSCGYKDFDGLCEPCFDDLIEEGKINPAEGWN